MSKLNRMSCNIKFNTGNPHHVKAAEALNSVGSRQKTALVTLAILEYLENHSQVDISELEKIQQASWHSQDKQKPKRENAALGPSVKKSKPQPPVSPANSAKEKQDGDQATMDAISFYDIG